MTKRFEGKRHNVWLDSSTTAVPHLCVQPSDNPHREDPTCYVSTGLWMGIAAARELRDLLTESIATVEAEQAGLAVTS